MDTLLKLSPAQSLLLRTAARRTDGRVIPPDTLRGGARVKVLTALLQRGWVEPADGGHVLTDAGYAAIGQQRPAPPDASQSATPPTTSNFWRASRSVPAPSSPRWWWRCAARRGQPVCN